MRGGGGCPGLSAKGQSSLEPKTERAARSRSPALASPPGEAGRMTTPPLSRRPLTSYRGSQRLNPTGGPGRRGGAVSVRREDLERHKPPSPRQTCVSHFTSVCLSFFICKMGNNDGAHLIVVKTT